MEPDLAAEASESMQAAPAAGAENEKEREKSALLEQMDGPEEAEVGAEAPEAEPEAVEAPDEAGAEAARVDARRKTHEALTRDFPDALVEGSELATACREELAYLRESGSPLADDPEAEYKVARRMVRLMGLGVRPAAEPVAKAAPRRSIRPIPMGGAPVESPATVLERRVAGAKSTGDMLSLLREIGTPFEALLKR